MIVVFMTSLSVKKFFVTASLAHLDRENVATEPVKMVG